MRVQAFNFPMKWNWLHLLTCFLLLGLAAPLRAEPAYWVISDDDTEILLVGTVHMGRPGQLSLPEEITQSLPLADRIYLEADVDLRKGPAGSDGMEALGRLPEGTTLRDMLPRDVYDRLVRKLKAIDVDMKVVENYRPWAISLMMQVVHINKMGFRHEDGVEAMITELAEQAGIQIHGLEARNTAFSYLKEMSSDAEVDALASSLDEMDEVEAYLEQIMLTWQNGDLPAMERLLVDSMAETPEFAEAILFRRTRDWVVRTVNLMEVPGVFIMAVGAGHLLGEKGMPALLREAGLSVRRGGQSG